MTVFRYQILRQNASKTPGEPLNTIKSNKKNKNKIFKKSKILKNPQNRDFCQNSKIK